MPSSLVSGVMLLKWFWLSCGLDSPRGTQGIAVKNAFRYLLGNSLLWWQRDATAVLQHTGPFKAKFHKDFLAAVS